MRSRAEQLDSRIKHELGTLARYELERASQGDESLDLRKRIAATREKLRKLAPDSLLRVAFAKFDSDGSGKLSANEVAEAIAFTRREGEPSVGAEDIDRFIRYRDSDGDGEINFSEFREYFQLL